MNAIHSDTRRLIVFEIDIFGGFSQLVAELKKAFNENRNITSIYVLQNNADIENDNDVTFLNANKTLMVTFGNDPIPPKKGTVEYLRNELMWGHNFTPQICEMQSKKNTFEIPARNPGYPSRVTVYHNNEAYVVMFDKIEGFKSFEVGVEVVFKIKAKIRIMKNINGGIISLTDESVRLLDDNEVLYIAYDNEPDPDPPLAPHNYLNTLRKILAHEK